MVKIAKQLNLWNWRGAVLSLLTTAIIGLFTIAVTSYRSIAQGARMGKESFEKVCEMDKRVDVIEQKQAESEYNQRAVNIRLDNDVQWIKQTLIEIKQDINK